MRLGKVLSVGEAEHAPAGEPVAAQPEPAVAVEGDRQEPAAAPVRR